MQWIPTQVRRGVGRQVLRVFIAQAALASAVQAQAINVQLGDSARIRVATGASVAVPLGIDLSAKGTLSIASLQGTLRWGASRLRFDSLRAVTATGWTVTPQPAGSDTGAVRFASYATSALAASGPIAVAYFTAASTPGGTRVDLLLEAVGNEAGQTILSAARVRGQAVCAGPVGNWGDVTDDGVVNVMDAQQIARFTVGLPVVNAAVAAARGDVTNDGNINVLDAQQVARYSVSLSAAARISTPVWTVPAVSSVSLSPADALTLPFGGRRSIGLTARASDGLELSGCVAESWSSSDTTVVSVSATGLLVAKASGAATITGRSGTPSATLAVSVQAPPAASVTVTPASPTVAAGGTQALTATVRDSAGTALSGRVVTWASSDTTKAVVSPTGIVTGRAGGSAIITATSEGRSGTATVAISSVASITVRPPYGAFVVGDTGRFVFLPLALDSTTVVIPEGGFSTSASGNQILAGATACTAEGCTQRITAQNLADGQNPRTVLVRVFPTNGPVNGPPVGTFQALVISNVLDSLVLTGPGFQVGTPYTPPEITVGSSFVVYPYVFYQGGYSQATNAEFTVTAGSATVQPGLYTKGSLSARSYFANVTPTAPGVVMVQARLRKSDGTYWTSSLTFNAVPSGVSTVEVTPSTARLMPSMTIPLSGMAKDASGNAISGTAFAWTSSNPAVATVSPRLSASPVVTAVSSGTATITATVGGKSASATITVSTTPGITALMVGEDHSCALGSGAVVRCWGGNASGQLGNGGLTASSTPVTITGGQTFSSLAANGSAFSSCAITGAATAYCWGSNGYGQIGDSTRTTRSSPTLVTGGLSFQQIASGASYTCGIVLSGAAYCWGWNREGMLGDGTIIDRWVPTAVSGGLTFSKISGGAFTTCGLTPIGNAYCWGFNTGASGSSFVPQQVMSGTTFSELIAGHGTGGCGITTAGVTYCWGDNTHGQLGTGNTSSYAAPTQVSGGRTFVRITRGRMHTCALETSGAAYCWGQNDSGQLGDGTTTNRTVPTAVGGGLRFLDITAGGEHTCAATVSGAVYCWGRNQNGQLGDGSTTSQTQPTLSGATVVWP